MRKLTITYIATIITAIFGLFSDSLINISPPVYNDLFIIRIVRLLCFVLAIAIAHWQMQKKYKEKRVLAFFIISTLLGLAMYGIVYNEKVVLACQQKFVKGRLTSDAVNICESWGIRDKDSCASVYIEYLCADKSPSEIGGYIWEKNSVKSNEYILIALYTLVATSICGTVFAGFNAIPFAD